MLINANALRIPLADRSVHCCITSPPYWGLRDYGTATWQGGDTACDHRENDRRGTRPQGANNKFHGGDDTSQTHPYRDTCAKCGANRVDAQLGLEATPDEYVAHMVEVFREVWRVLRDDGTAWLNLGDSYGTGTTAARVQGSRGLGANTQSAQDAVSRVGGMAKQLIGIPWRVAFALQADGWYLRSDIIWSKPNPMPESVTDRPTKSHEYVFLLAKQPRYFYDADAIKEGASPNTHERISQNLAAQVGSFRANGGNKTNGPMKAVIKGSTRKMAAAGSGIKNNDSFEAAMALRVTTRNRRTVWTVATSPFSGAHFATFPPALVAPMVLAGTSAKGVCNECGKPWERITERQEGSPDSWRGSKFDDGKNLEVHPNVGRREDAKTNTAYAKGTTANRLALLRQQARENGGEYTNGSKTTGWQSTCKHSGALVDPAIVLDPFCGSGTVGEVCRETGRRFVGLDLSMTYLRDLALPRAEKKQSADAHKHLPLFDVMGVEVNGEKAMEGV